MSTLLTGSRAALPQDKMWYPLFRRRSIFGKAPAAAFHPKQTAFPPPLLFLCANRKKRFTRYSRRPPFSVFVSLFMFTCGNAACASRSSSPSTSRTPPRRRRKAPVPRFVSAPVRRLRKSPPAAPPRKTQPRTKQPRASAPRLDMPRSSLPQTPTGSLSRPPPPQPRLHRPFPARPPAPAAPAAPNKPSLPPRCRPPGV